MNQFFEAFANMFRIPDLRKRLLFTLAMLAVYRLGAFLPTPGINTDVLQQFFNQNAGSVLGVIDLFSGGNFRRLTIFALGIMPYITASIILQLMTVVWPYLERLQKEGELGRRKITQYTRYLTILLSIVQSLSIAETLQHTGGPNNQPLVYNPGLGFILMTILTLTTGSAFIMWLGEQITERGVGNGMSLIIFAGIVVGLPRAVADLFDKFKTAQWGPFTGLALLVLTASMIAVVGVIVFVEGGQRAQDDGRANDVPAAASQFRRCDSADFCQFAAYVSGHDQSGSGKEIFCPRLVRDASSLGRALIYLGLHYVDYRVCVFLCGHRVQSHRTRRQHAEVRRVYPGDSPGAQYLGAHRPGSSPLDVCRRSLPGGCMLAPGVADGRDSSPASSRGGHVVR
jgi:hypothetical protein